ncbi:MAG: ATPase, partial [Albidovulum sp.]
IKGSEAHTAELIRRFDKAPKPMYYSPAFLTEAWDGYRAEKRVEEAKVDPDDFVRWTYARALAHRQPLYAAMAEKWGVTVTAEDVAGISTPAGFEDLIARALEERG